MARFFDWIYSVGISASILNEWINTTAKIWPVFISPSDSFNEVYFPNFESLNHAALLTCLQNLEECRANDKEEENSEVKRTDRHFVLLAFPQSLRHFKSIHFSMQVFIELATTNLKPSVFARLLRPRLRLVNVWNIVSLVRFVALLWGTINASVFCVFSFRHLLSILKKFNKYD